MIYTHILTTSISFDYLGHHKTCHDRLSGVLNSSNLHGEVLNLLSYQACHVDKLLCRILKRHVFVQLNIQMS